MINFISYIFIISFFFLTISSKAFGKASNSFGSVQRSFENLRTFSSTLGSLRKVVGNLRWLGHFSEILVMTRWKSHSFESELGWQVRRVERVNKLTKNRHLPSLGLSFEPGWYQHEVAITTWSLFSIHMIYLSGGSRGGTWGALVPPIFKPKGGPKGQKTFFWRPSPPPPPNYLKIWICHWYCVLPFSYMCNI